MTRPTAGAPDPVASALAALGHRGGELQLGGVPVRELAERFGTPLYAFDASVLQTRLHLVQQAFADRLEVLFSLKANPNAAVAGVLRQAGAGVEVASQGEFLVAQAAGWPAAQIRFAGPGKSPGELTHVIDAGIGWVHVEAEYEAQLIAGLAAARGRRQRIALRVNLPQEMTGSRLRMGGASSRFGIDAAQVPALAERLRRLPGIELRGLHVYGGTQNFAAESFAAQARDVLALADELSAQGHDIDDVDLGGGFGIAVYTGDPTFDLGAAGRLVLPLLEPQQGRRRCSIELGRFLCAPAGIYVARVLYTKTSGDVRQVVLDGGLHHCAAAAGVGTVMRRPALLTTVAAPGRNGVEQCLGGPLCTPQDQFADAVSLPGLAAGDLVAVLHAGAYGVTFSPTRFLSHPAPAEVLVEGGRPRLVRRRGEAADALRDQLP